MPPGAPGGVRWKMRTSKYSVFFTPAFVFLGLFTFVPLAYMLGIAFSNASLVTLRWRYVGLQNFFRFFTNPDAGLVLANTLRYVAIVIFFQFVIGFLFALLLNSLPASRLIKSVIGAVLFLPWIFSDVIAVGAWKWMFNDTYGMVNYYITRLGLPEVGWFSDPRVALYTLIMLNIWKGYPFSMVLEHAGLQTIPAEVTEAAKIDGAGSFKTLVYVKLPLMRYIILSNLILITIYTFNLFNLVYAATQGGPLHRTEIIGVYMYNEAFNTSRIGYSASIAMVMTAFNTIAALVYLALLRNRRAAA